MNTDEKCLSPIGFKCSKCHDCCLFGKECRFEKGCDLSEQKKLDFKASDENN